MHIHAIQSQISVAVCDLNKKITDRIAEESNVKTYNDVNGMLHNEEIECCVLQHQMLST